MSTGDAQTLNNPVLLNVAAHLWEDFKIFMIAVLQQGAAAHQVRGWGVFWCSVSSSSVSDVLLMAAASGQTVVMLQYLMMWCERFSLHVVKLHISESLKTTCSVCPGFKKKHWVSFNVTVKHTCLKMQVLQHSSTCLSVSLCRCLFLFNMQSELIHRKLTFSTVFLPLNKSQLQRRAQLD